MKNEKTEELYDEEDQDVIDYLSSDRNVFLFRALLNLHERSVLQSFWYVNNFAKISFPYVEDKRWQQKRAGVIPYYIEKKGGMTVQEQYDLYRTMETRDISLDKHMRIPTSSEYRKAIEDFRGRFDIGESMFLDYDTFIKLYGNR